MGCVKSKKSDPTQNANSVERVDGQLGTQVSERTILVDSETGPARDSPRVNPVLLDYAQRLSEEIIARAVQQWAEVDSRYSDIPYIECDVPWGNQALRQGHTWNSGEISGGEGREMQYHTHTLLDGNVTAVQLGRGFLQMDLGRAL